MKLLLVEDYRPLALRIKKRLGTFDVTLAHTAADGLAKATARAFDVIILDLNLPDGNGYDICRQLREDGIVTPILILTGVDEATSRIELLQVGADDYLTKPFDSAELEARLLALRRRATLSYAASEVISINDLTIDINRRAVTRDGDRIVLRRKEFDLLAYLARNRGRVVTRTMILDNVWEANKESWPNTIDVHIKHLRDKVDRPYKHPIIKTAYGIGYLVDDRQQT